MNLSDNFALNYFVAFVGGVLVSLTPCVYPLMPVTAGIIGALNTQGTRFRGFVISLVYVLGLAVTYSILAVVAALSGKVFGQFQTQLQNGPVVFLFVGAVLIVFALAMFNVITIPSVGAEFRGKIKLRNLWTVFFLGVAGGFIVGPCATPVLGSLLILVASKKNVLYGSSLLFVYAYGVGASLILVGTFSGFLSRLPKSGPWLVVVKTVCGMTVFIIGVMFLLKGGTLMR
jgi:thiol:disulfide interchange protein DsbD